MARARLHMAFCTECGLAAGARTVANPTPHFGQCRDCDDFQPWEWHEMPPGADPLCYGLTLGAKDRWGILWVRQLEYARA